MDKELEYIGRQFRNEVVKRIWLPNEFADRIVRILGWGIATIVPGFSLESGVEELCLINAITFLWSEYCFLLETTDGNTSTLTLEDEGNKKNIISYRIFLLLLFWILPALWNFYYVLSPLNLIWLYAYFAIDTRNHSWKKLISEWASRELKKLRSKLPKPTTV